MAVILNMIPLDQKQNSAFPNVTSKDGIRNKDSGKNSMPESSFAKALNIETDKSGMDVDSKLKNNDNMQLMAAMAGMVVPMVVNFTTVDQVVNNATDTLGGTASVTQVQLGSVVPVAPQVQLESAVPVAPQAQLGSAVPVASQAQLGNVVPVASQAQLGNVVPVAPQAQLGNVVPVAPQAQLGNVVPVVPQTQLGNVVPVAPQAQLGSAVSIASQAQLGSVVPVVPQAQLGSAVPVVPQAQLGSAVSIASQAQLGNVVPVVPQAQLGNVVPVVPQAQLKNVVPVVPQAQLGNVVPVVPQAQLGNIVPVVPQAQLENAVPVAPQAQLGNVVPVVPQAKLGNAIPVAPQAQLVSAVPMDTGLVILSPEKTTINTQADTIQPGEFPELKAQVQLQKEVIIEQVKVTEVSIKNTEMLTNDPVLSNNTSVVAAMGNANILGNNSNKQFDGKKIVVSQINVEEAEGEKPFNLVEAVDVKPVLTPQVAVAVGERLLSENKETVDVSLPNLTVKNDDIFGTMLNQQGLKIENQRMVEIKQGAAQPVADSYNITSQIVNQARLVAGVKNTEMIIQLKPEHLGELTFKVTVENGVVSASFHSNNAEVRNVIESTLSQLKQDLANQGLKIDNVGVYSGLGQFFSNDQQPGGYQQPVIKAQNKKTEEDFLEVFEATDSVNRALDVTGVDYRA